MAAIAGMEGKRGRPPKELQKLKRALANFDKQGADAEDDDVVIVSELEDQQSQLGVS